MIYIYIKKHAFNDIPNVLVSVLSTWRRCCPLHDTYRPRNGGKDQKVYQEILISLHLQSHDNFGTLVREHRSSWVLRKAEDPRVRCAHYRTISVLLQRSEERRQSRGRDAVLDVSGSSLALRQFVNVM